MAFISAKAVRRLHPKARIILLLDEETDRSLRRRKSPLIELADQYTVVATDYRGAVASRYVKTQQRQLIEGPYLFMDVDAIPIRSLSGLFETTSIFAAVLDKNPFRPYEEVPTAVRDYFQEMEWEMPAVPYINSGVMYWSDRPESYRIGEEWHERWHAMYKRTGTHTDQTAMLSALLEVNAPVEVLSPGYNLLVGMPLELPLMGVRENIAARRQIVREAHVWHFAGVNAQRGTVLHKMVDHLRSTSEVNFDLLDRAVASGDPWANSMPTNLAEDPSAAIERLLLLGDRFAALRLWMRFKVGRLLQRRSLSTTH